MKAPRLEVLRRGLPEYGSPSRCCRVRVEASMGGGGGVGVGAGSGDAEAERLLACAVAGWGTLDFLTRTAEGWSEETCFSRDRI